MVTVPIRRDAGHVDVFPAYRVQHSSVLGPTKGGIRYDPHVTLGEVRGARRVDDVEVRAAATPVRRREGRRPLQPARAVAARAGAADAALHERASRRDRAAGGHPRAGHGHERADDGVDHGHVLDAGRSRRAGDRHRQADLARRLALGARGDRRRRRDGDRARVPATRLEPRRAALRRAGLRQRRRDRGAGARLEGRDGGRCLRHLGRDLLARAGSTSRRAHLDRRPRQRSTAFRTCGTSRTSSCSSCRATSSCSRRSKDQLTAENAPRIDARLVVEGANGPTTIEARRHARRARAFRSCRTF